MVQLYWPKNSYYTDRQRDERYDGPGEFDVPDEAVEQYLSRGWERPDTDPDAERESADANADGVEEDVDDDDDTADEADGDDVDDQEDDAPDEATLADALDNSVGDLEEELETGNYDDDLDELLELEKAGDDRTTAKTAINSRMDDVQE